MANLKISGLPELAATPAADDVIAIVDTSTTTTKKITPTNFMGGKSNYHGTEASGTLSFVDGTHILTMASGENTYWYLGVKYTTAAAITIDISAGIAANTLYFITFDDSSGSLVSSTTPFNWFTQVPVATIFWNGTAGAIMQETHGYRRDLNWHDWAHDTIGTRYGSGLTKTAPTTADDATLTIETGTVYDEDLEITTGQQTTMRGWYQASDGVYTFSDYAFPYLGASADPYWLDTDDYTLKSVADSDFVCYWVYATTDIDRPIYMVPTQAATAHNTIKLARAETAPALGGLNLTPETKLIYRFIYKGDGQFQESDDFRLTSPLPSGGSASTTAGAVSFSPTGDIVATTVQTAIEELDDEKAAIAQTFYIGTTEVAINRASATLSLAGIGTLGVGAITSSGTLALGANDITMSGSIAIDGTRVTKGWFTAIEVTNEAGLTIGGSAISTIYSPIAGSASIVTTGALASGTIASGFGTINIGTSNAVSCGSVELGHADDTTLARSAAGVLAVEGVVIPSISSTNTLTNKRITSRVATFTTDATPDVNSDNYDAVTITAQAAAITDVNVTGTPTNFQKLIFRIKDNGTARAITWGTSFEDAGVALPTTTVISKLLTVGFIYNTVTSKWGCVAVGNET